MQDADPVGADHLDQVGRGAGRVPDRVQVVPRVVLDVDQRQPVVAARAQELEVLVPELALVLGRREQQLEVALEALSLEGEEAVGLLGVVAMEDLPMVMDRGARVERAPEHRGPASLLGEDHDQPAVWRAGCDQGIR